MTKKLVTQVVELDIKEIKPYWRNPKTGANVEQVKTSIQEFGYNQYIVVDKKYVIIAGHSRYKALTELGYEKIPVIITDLSASDAKKYRILDNKVAEYNIWNEHELGVELREFVNDDVMKQFYDMTQFEGMSAKAQSSNDVTEKQVNVSQQQLENQFKDLGNKRVGGAPCVCPECGFEFMIG